MTFTLPQRLEAHAPREPRDGVRLLVSAPDGAVSHHPFVALPELLRPGDLLVVNDSATMAAALGDLHLSTWLGGDDWVVELRGPRPELPGGAALELLGPYRGSARLQRARLRLPLPWPEYLRRHGAPIRYPYASPLGIEAYQTVFARELGSAEMPSAGRPFTPRVLSLLRERGVELASLTLHCGVSSLESHEEPFPERYRVPPETLRKVRGRGGRVIAVGTTVVRALETAWDGPLEGWTERVVRPGDPLHVDGLLTGLHEPKASHLLMLEALAGGASLERAYAAALEHGYLWHEFGDLHLLWKGSAPARRK